MRDVPPADSEAPDGLARSRSSRDAPGENAALTIGEALAQRERQQFVGREREIGEFASWLAGPGNSPKILSVIGPGGIGKTTLLQAFARRARAEGKRVAFVDGRVIVPSPAGLAAAMGARSPQEALVSLNSARALLVLDSFEDLRPLTHFLLEDFLPSLTSEVPVVIASRSDVTAQWRGWRELVRVMALTGLPLSEAREFLCRRGVPDPAAIDRILTAAGGYPLALAMAADVALRTGAAAIAELPEWRMAVRSLVEDLLRYADPGLGPLLEAASVLRQFDEATLAEMTPTEDVSRAFARLCSLSIVRPGPRGLMLHDEVRGTLREDLRWRNPERYEALRRRAVEHYRRRLAEVGAEDAGWVVTEVTYLSEDPFIHHWMFGNDDPSELWAEPARVSDRPLVLELQASVARTIRDRRERPAPEELDPALLEKLLERPEARVTIAWSHTHGAVGYGLALEMVPAVAEVLPREGAIRRLVRAALRPTGSEGAGRDATVPAKVWFLGTIMSAGEQPELALGVLTREITRLFADRALLLACSADPVYLSALGSFGFRTVEFEAPEGAYPGLTGKALDMRLLGSEAYLEAIANGQAVPRMPPLDSLEAEVEAALEHWDDDRWLEGSPLADLGRHLLGERDDKAAPAVRHLLTAAIAQARTEAPAEKETLRAIEIAYMQGAPKLAAAARHLGVSRPTFYRMRKRGLHATTQAIASMARTGCRRPKA